VESNEHHSILIQNETRPPRYSEGRAHKIICSKFFLFHAHIINLPLYGNKHKNGTKHKPLAFANSTAKKEEGRHIHK